MVGISCCHLIYTVFAPNQFCVMLSGSRLYREYSVVYLAASMQKVISWFIICIF